MDVRAYRDSDWPEWLRMSMALFPATADEHEPDMRAFRERDALLDNDVSHRAHAKAGYIEVDRVITYRKPLT